jgi:hypothetical protein
MILTTKIYIALEVHASDLSHSSEYEPTKLSSYDENKGYFIPDLGGTNVKLIKSTVVAGLPSMSGLHSRDKVALHLWYD